MKIERLEIYRVAMPLLSPFNTAFGDTNTVESIIVKLSSDGIVGWGETAPWRYPAYSPESAIGAFLTIKKFLVPLVLGKKISTGKELQEIMSVVKGNQFAKAGIDLAWWDCYARMENTPLNRIIGGIGDTADVGADFGVMKSHGDLLEKIAEAKLNGYKRIKLKFRPGWAIDMVKAVRHQFPTETFHIDCNSAYSLNELNMFKALDDYNLTMIEQPLKFDDLIDHAALRKQIKTPICLDESINDIDKVRKAIEIGACDWVNIKPGRVGGITKAIEIHDICKKNNIPCWIGGMLESSIGGYHCLALATLSNIRYPSDIFPTNRFYYRDLGSKPLNVSEPGKMSVLQLPGIGVEADEEMLKKLTIEKVSFTA
ncbi:MAG: o-succinylbenzoate synthase [Spirochaetes bacterium]|nr:o-succinylbenzoate synthase [Spirochaetota bacterium]